MQVRQKLYEVPLKSNNKLKKKKGNLAAEYDRAAWHSWFHRHLLTLETHITAITQVHD